MRRVGVVGEEEEEEGGLLVHMVNCTFRPNEDLFVDACQADNGQQRVVYYAAETSEWIPDYIN